MKAGRYNIRDLFSNRSMEQILIPEIQRDYLWNKKQIEPLLIDLNAEIESYNKSINEIEINVLNGDQKIVPDFIDFYSKQKYSYSVGFIYAYQDTEYAGKYFLIDGQQRLTTLYLILLALAIKENKREHFKKVYLLDSVVKLDYRVREASHDFMQNFFTFLLSDGNFSIEKVKEQYWYFSYYNQDVTIQSLLNNYSTIVSFIESEKSKINYEYIQNFVCFWYFDTSISEQGEELYIYMNSRGEPVEENENIKAILLSEVPDTEKSNWGRLWEKWQDFFWLYRNSNPNADNGFNEFLRWIQIIKMTEKLKVVDDSEENIANKKIIDVIKWENEKCKLDTSYFSLVDIENYFEAVGVVFKDINESYQEVLGIYELFNFSSRNFISPEWMSPIKSGRKANISQIDCFRLLPVLYYCKVVTEKHGTINNQNLFRVVRYFYNIENLANISKAANIACINAINLIKNMLEISDDILSILDVPKPSKTLITAEETFKLSQFKNPPTNFSRTEVESLFWNLEDHRFNRGEINHLYRLAITEEVFDASLFKAISKTFFELFPMHEIEENPNKNKIQSLLFLYGSYWFKDTPRYYENNACGIWYYNVRTEEFLKFLVEFHNSNSDLDSFVENKKKAFLNGMTVEAIKEITEIHHQLFTYSILFDYLNLNIWDEGDYISYYVTDDGKNYEGLFANGFNYKNTSRYIGQGTPLDLISTIQSNMNGKGLDETLKEILIKYS